MDGLRGRAACLAAELHSPVLHAVPTLETIVAIFRQGLRSSLLAFLHLRRETFADHIAAANFYYMQERLVGLHLAVLGEEMSSDCETHPWTPLQPKDRRSSCAPLTE